MPDDSGRPDLLEVAEDRAQERYELEHHGGGSPPPPAVDPIRGLHYQDETGLHLLGEGFAAATNGSLLAKTTVGGQPDIALVDPATSSGELDVTSFGAHWDGTTDDTAALEAAIAAAVAAGGAVIRLPPGTGLIAKTIKLPKNLTGMVILRGSGALNSTLKCGENTLFTFANTVAGDTVGNVAFEDFCVDGANLQVANNKAVPVLIGTTESCNTRVNILNVRVARVRGINVPNLGKKEGGRRWIYLNVFQETPNAALNRIENIDVADCDFAGGQYGVYVGAFGKEALPANVYMAHVRIRKVRHLIPELAPEFGYNAHVQLGACAWSDGQDILVEGCYGENSWDVGIEMDIPGTVRDCTMVNSNDTGFLWTSYNAAFTKAPNVAQLTATAAVGATIVKVASGGLSVGGIVTFGSQGHGEETRQIKTIPNGESIELTEALTIEHANGSWLAQAESTGNARWRGENIEALRTLATPGSQSGVRIQNAENTRPAPALIIDGYKYTRTYTGHPEILGEVIGSSCGTEAIPFGTPAAVHIKNIKADIAGEQFAGSETVQFSPFWFVWTAPGVPLELSGELTVEGAGTTSTGKISGRLIDVKGNALLELDIATKWTIKKTGGEAWRAIALNLSRAGAISGRIRHRARRSVIEEGGGEQRGVRLGKGCGHASKRITTTITGGALAAKSTTIPVPSTEGFSVGQRIVVDALSTAKSEVFTITSLVANTSITIASVGNEPGTLVEHANGAVVAALTELQVVDCDWVGLGTAGSGLSAEDEVVLGGVRSRGCIFPTNANNTTITPPESNKFFQVNTGRAGNVVIKGGTVTKVDWASNPNLASQVAAATNCSIHVSPGDLVKVTYSVVPESIVFIPDRV